MAVLDGPRTPSPFAQIGNWEFLIGGIPLYGFQICSLLVFDRSAEQIGANPPVYGFAPISLAPAFCYLLLIIVFVFK